MLSINISELIWTIINFFLLYFLLKHFLYDPVVRFLDARQARVNEAQAKEDAARAEREESARQIEDFYIIYYLMLSFIYHYHISQLVSRKRL